MSPSPYHHALATAPTPTNPLALCRFHDVHDTWPKLRPLPWSTFAAQLQAHDHRRHKAGPLFSPTQYPFGARRGARFVEAVSMLLLDYDGTAPPWALLADAGLTYAAYTTWAHWLRDEAHPVPAPHWRVVLPLAEDVPAAAWPDTYHGALEMFPGADPACTDAGRMFYLPACPLAGPVAPEVRFQETGRSLVSASLPPVPPRPRRIGAGSGYAIPTVAPGTGTPAEDYDGRTSIVDLLLRDGWTDMGQHGDRRHLGRPGKDYSVPDARCSATADHLGNNLLHVFSSNAPPLEAGGTYGPFRYLTLVHYGGDAGRATRELRRAGYGDPLDGALAVRP